MTEGNAAGINVVHLENEYAWIKTGFKKKNDFLVMESFLRFRVSRPGHFNELRTGEASPLPVLLGYASESGGPPFRNSLK